MTQNSCEHLIIGGGINGCSIAYPLTRIGEQDVTLLEKSTRAEGATWYATGRVDRSRALMNDTAWDAHLAAVPKG